MAACYGIFNQLPYVGGSRFALLPRESALTSFGLQVLEGSAQATISFGGSAREIQAALQNLAGLDVRPAQLTVIDGCVARGTREGSIAQRSTPRGRCADVKSGIVPQIHLFAWQLSGSQHRIRAYRDSIARDAQ